MGGYSLWLLPPRDSPIFKTLSKLIEDTVPTHVQNYSHIVAEQTAFRFVPHLTLTADIYLDEHTNFQEWLDALQLQLQTPFDVRSEEGKQRTLQKPPNDVGSQEDSQGPKTVKDVAVNFKDLTIGEKLVTKLTLGVHRTELLVGIGTFCRAIGTLQAGNKEQDRVLSQSTKIEKEEEEEEEKEERGKWDQARNWAESVWRPHVSLLYSSMEISEDCRRAVLQDVEAAGIQVSDRDPDPDQTAMSWIGGRIQLVSTYKKIQDWEVLAEREL